MKLQQSTTSEQGGPSLGEIGRWLQSLLHLPLRLSPRFARPEVRQHALLYLQAILSDIPRKNGWQIAEQARQARPYGMQRLLSRAAWDEDGVRDDLRAFVCQTLHPPPLVQACASRELLFPVLVLDESGFPKRGRHSAGVGPQYCGRTGRVENCQVGVFLSYVTAAGHALIDRELYLPEDWCSDRPRRQAAHIPEPVTFRTKPELGQLMIQRAQAAGLPCRWVVADTVYGHSPALRAFLEEQGLAYAASRPLHRGGLCANTGRPPARGCGQHCPASAPCAGLAAPLAEPGHQRRASLRLGAPARSTSRQRGRAPLAADAPLSRRSERAGLLPRLGATRDASVHHGAGRWRPLAHRRGSASRQSPRTRPL